VIPRRKRCLAPAQVGRDVPHRADVLLPNDCSRPRGMLTYPSSWPPRSSLLPIPASAGHDPSGEGVRHWTLLR
jgi:hypothetical protein